MRPSIILFAVACLIATSSVKATIDIPEDGGDLLLEVNQLDSRSLGSTDSGLGSGLQSAKSNQQAKALAALRKTPGGKGSSAAAIGSYMRLNSAKYKLKKATDFSS